MNNLDVKKIVEFEGRIYEELKDYINSYIGWVESNIPCRFYSYFKVGVAGSHQQFGNHYGFENSYDEYCVPGSGYNIANDFNAYVRGCTSRKELIAFVKCIPEFLENGLKAMEKQSNQGEIGLDKTQQILKDLF